MAGLVRCLLFPVVLVALCHVGSCSEFCKYRVTKFCSGYTPYCCKLSDSTIYPPTEYCCSDCLKSIFSATRSSCYDVDSSVVIGAVIGALFFIGLIVGLIVLCCLGCICTGLTGRSRRGRVVNPNATTGVGGGYPAAGVTVYTTTSAYPQQGYGQPVVPSTGGQGGYPPATGAYQGQPYPVTYGEAPPPYQQPK